MREDIAKLCNKEKEQLWFTILLEKDRFHFCFWNDRIMVSFSGWLQHYLKTEKIYLDKCKERYVGTKTKTTEDKVSKLFLIKQVTIKPNIKIMILDL